MDAATFRTDFPEFASETFYPTASINFWLGVAAILILPCVWGELAPYVTELFVAHNLALERAATIGSANGGVPGMNSGVTQSKTIDKLSISYNSNVGIVKDAGHWNLTTYGLRFIQLVNLRGMGGYQAGAGAAYMAPGTLVVYGGAYGAGWPYVGA